jgi:hypothetical protein
MSDDTTRRRFVTGATTLGVAALAGCTDIVDRGGSDDTTTGEMMTTTEDGMTTTEEGMNDGDDMDDTTEDEMMSTMLTVCVRNVSDRSTLQTMDGGKAVPLSPAAYAVHEGDNPLFAPGAAASTGLERLAEDGSPTALVEEVSMETSDATVDSVAVPKDADEPAPIGPGESYEFTVEAAAGKRLSLATMFVQSNDLFYAPGTDGVPLYEDGEPVTGDVTDQFTLWDAGTEQNQEPGTGGDQAPRQMEADSGPSEDATVRNVMSVDDGFDYPATGDVLEVTVTVDSMEG